MVKWWKKVGTEGGAQAYEKIEGGKVALGEKWGYLVGILRFWG